MCFRILADAVVLLHLAFVGFVVCGGLAVWRWRWVGWVHVPAVIWAVGIEWTGAVCPLTPLELWLRAQAGMTAYEGDFIGRYVWPLLYPGELTRVGQVALGGLALGLNLAAYGYGWRRRGRRPVG